MEKLTLKMISQLKFHKNLKIGKYVILKKDRICTNRIMLLNQILLTITSTTLTEKLLLIMHSLRGYNWETTKATKL